MTHKYVVIDETGNVSYDSDEPEGFASAAAAEKRAKELARSAPGEPIGIYVLEAVATAPVGSVEISAPPSK